MDDRLRQDARRSREAVRAGALRGDALLHAITAVPPRDRDAWVDELLALPELPDDGDALPPGAVPYLPCGVDAILRAVREAPLNREDVFVDLGAGIGRVALLAHLVTGARAIGVELQPHLVETARKTARRLALLDGMATFIVGDAADVEVEPGAVYFIYASFGRATLRRVLSRLERDARRKPRFTLCAVDFEVSLAEQPWLRARPSQSPELVFYDAEHDVRGV